MLKKVILGLNISATAILGAALIYIYAFHNALSAGNSRIIMLITLVIFEGSLILQILDKKNQKKRMYTTFALALFVLYAIASYITKW